VVNIFCIYIFGKTRVGLHFGRFFSQTHLVTLSLSSEFSFQIVRRKSRKPDRFVTQLLFPRWPEVGLPIGADFLHFVKAALACRQSTSEGKVLIHSR
jgi:hypothetical protein